MFWLKQNFIFLCSRSSAQDPGRLGLFRRLEAGRERVKMWSLFFLVCRRVVPHTGHIGELQTRQCERMKERKSKSSLSNFNPDDRPVPEYFSNVL